MAGGTEVLRLCREKSPGINRKYDTLALVNILPIASYLNGVLCHVCKGN
jgi:hypothetical protein